MQFKVQYAPVPTVVADVEDASSKGAKVSEMGVSGAV